MLLYSTLEAFCIDVTDDDVVRDEECLFCAMNESIEHSLSQCVECNSVNDVEYKVTYWLCFSSACTADILPAGANMSVANLTNNSVNTTMKYQCDDGYYLCTTEVRS